MNKTEILVTGRNENILQNITRRINNNVNWNVTVAGSDEEAIEKFHHRNFDLVILSEGISKAEEKKLRIIFSYQHPEVIIIRYNESEIDMLSNEITEAIEKNKKENKPGVSFIDDALKNAGLNIDIQ